MVSENKKIVSSRGILKGFPGGSSSKDSACQCRCGIRSLDQEDPLEGEMVIHSSILAWEIPRPEKPGFLNVNSWRAYSSWSCKELDTTEHAHTEEYLGKAAAAAAAKSLQSCPTLCDPIDGSPPGSPIPGILQARTLEWGAITFSIGKVTKK